MELHRHHPSTVILRRKDHLNKPTNPCEQIKNLREVGKTNKKQSECDKKTI